jgi:hypothetical protein
VVRAKVLDAWVVAARDERARRRASGRTQAIFGGIGLAGWTALMVGAAQSGNRILDAPSQWTQIDTAVVVTMGSLWFSFSTLLATGVATLTTPGPTESALRRYEHPYDSSRPVEAAPTIGSFSLRPILAPTAAGGGLAGFAGTF